MSGYHAVAVKGQLDPEEVVRAVYGLGDGDAVEASGPGEFPGHGAHPGSAMAARAAGWTLVFGGYPTDMYDDGETARLVDLSRGGAVFRWATESVTGAVGMDLFMDGAHRRRFWQIEGEVTGNTGDPLEGEPPGGLHELEPYDVDEWKIVEVMERHVAPWDTLAEAEYARFDFEPGGGGRAHTPADPPAEPPVEPAAEPRPWWKFW